MLLEYPASEYDGARDDHRVRGAPGIHFGEIQAPGQDCFHSPDPFADCFARFRRRICFHHFFRKVWNCKSAPNGHRADRASPSISSTGITVWYLYNLCICSLLSSWVFRPVSPTLTPPLRKPPKLREPAAFGDFSPSPYRFARQVIWRVPFSYSCGPLPIG